MLVIVLARLSPYSIKPKPRIIGYRNERKSKGSTQLQLDWADKVKVSNKMLKLKIKLTHDK